MIANDLTQLRRRLDDLAGVIDLVQTDDPESSREFIAITATITTYPTTAAAWYAVQLADAFGTEAEGNTATLVARFTGSVLALNLGASIPPVGTAVVVGQREGVFCFRYDA